MSANFKNAEAAATAALAATGRTLNGLRAAMEAAATTQTAKHIAAQEKAAKDGKVIEPEKIGGAEYDPVRESLRETLKAAFPTLFDESTPCIMVRAGEERALLGIIAGLGADCSQAEWAEWLAENSGRIVRSVAALGTHSSKFANTSTSLTIAAPAEFDETSPYLSSATVTTPCKLTYSGSAGDMKVARVLYAIFEHEAAGKTSLLDAISQNNEALISSLDIPQDLISALRTRMAKLPSIQEGVAQVIWPASPESPDVVLSPLPSAAVLAELHGLHQPESVKEALPGFYVPLETMKIGGSNPQNAGSLNSAVRGEHRIWRARLGTNQHTDEAEFLRRIWSKNWLNKPSKDLLEALGKDISKFDNTSKNVFLAKVCRGIVAQSTVFVREVAERAHDEPDAFMSGGALIRAVEGNPLWVLIKFADWNEVRVEVAERICAICESAVKTLATDADKRSRFIEQTEKVLAQFFSRYHN